MEAIQVIQAAELLTAWERGAAEPPYLRGLRLLAAALPDQELDTLAGWSLGRRDAALLSLRARLFGERLTSVATCPACASPVELDFRTSEIYAPYADEALPPLLAIAEDGHRYQVELHSLTTRDLISAADEPRRDLLIERCVTAALRDGTAIRADELPADVLAECARVLAECDPQADVQLMLTCPECNHRWYALFDILAYLWHEIEQWAGRTLREVHLLARAYGWNEAEILSLSPQRRQLYLQMVVG